MKKIIRIVVAAVILIGIVLALRHCSNRSGSGGKVQYKTETLSRERLIRTISASGTVEPEELVNVGAQVNGKIMSFGIDADGGKVDYRSNVKAGMVLAQIDDVLYAAELRQCKAEKLQAEAAIATAQANIRQAAAKKHLAELNWQRAQNLTGKKAMSKSDYDSAESVWISAVADEASATASLKQAEAQLAIAEAALIKAQRNMDYCVITSPVDGIIIDRRVSIGQTVVSNMSASSIFLIAKEFSRMQVWVSVNEADIGSIRTGMEVEFTVDAFPGTVFTGKVQKIRLNATMSQNVVTYIVEVVTDNKEGKLIPYLTANVKFILDERKDALTVSNAALRFRPTAEMVGPEEAANLNAPGTRLWLRGQDGRLRSVPATIGLNAGSKSELLNSTLKPGDEIVYAASIVQAAPAENGEAKSPFMPEPPKHTRGSGSAAQRQRAQENGAPPAK